MYYWNSSSKGRTPIPELEDNHLVSAFKYLEKSAIERWYLWTSGRYDDKFTGGMGLDVDDFETEDGHPFGPQDFCEHDIIYNALRREIFRRGLGMMFWFRDYLEADKLRMKVRNGGNFWL